MPQQTQNYAEQGGARWVVEGELKFPTGGKQTPNSGTQASAITDATAAAGANPTKAEYDALVTKFNALLAAVRGVGIIASS